jgi:hypothetical protein
MGEALFLVIGTGATAFVLAVGAVWVVDRLERICSIGKHVYTWPGTAPSTWTTDAAVATILTTPTGCTTVGHTSTRVRCIP